MNKSSVLKFSPLLICLLGIAGWFALYPDPVDPKNPKYVLWTHGFISIDPDSALATMVHDSYPERLVLGKNLTELRKRFGYLKPLHLATPYLQNQYSMSPWKGSEVMFLRDSPWMVVFESGTAVNLVLCKG